MLTQQKQQPKGVQARGLPVRDRNWARAAGRVRATKAWAETDVLQQKYSGS